MNRVKLLLIILVITACNSPVIKEENNQTETNFELELIANKVYDTLTLAKGVKATFLDSLSWPSALISYKGGFVIGQNPHRLTGDLNENTTFNNPNLKLSYYNIPKNEQINVALPGFQAAMCHAPWGGILIATTGLKRYEKGYIYHFNNGVLTRLDALGSSCFTGIAAHQTNTGQAIIYYSDFTNKNSNLLKFVADSGVDCRKGKIYAAKLPTDGWISLARNTNSALASQYATHAELLSNINEASLIAGIQFKDAISDVQFDKSEGTINYSVMPQIKKDYLFGAINYIFEDGGKYDGTSFHFKTILLAGVGRNFSHPAQFYIDAKKSIWVCTGMSVDEVGTEQYQQNGGNAVLLIPKSGVQTDIALRIAVAPHKGRFSGLIIDKKLNCIYTTLQDQRGKAVLLKLSGPSVKRLLE